MDNVFIINVGVNASHGQLRSPVFDDGTFEFIPIPERGRPRSCPECETLPRYCDLESFNNLNLLKFIPKKYCHCRVHNDPEFVSYTYGDYPTISPRAANLKKVEKGDFIFFLARLVKYKNVGFTKKAGFYFIGYFEVEDILREATATPKQSILRKFINNAHVRRALYDSKLWNGFWVFKGSKKSCRFDYSVPFSKGFFEKIIKNSRGRDIIWDRRTELQVIGSHTRACRMINEENTLRQFWTIINEHFVLN